ncbi:NUDIX domain-containing protein [Rhizobium sp. VS19-DR104.1]|nr:NUDIX domain-containing protein [Rhizobium sp. VS19-DR121]MBZ5820540.1 NUDIX domain-containing protein [Rhizobium sp. VS19-DR183]MBZ5844293.1 NUDIX domain-containing protein [Rhizobium sp. VS19-DR104.1]
MASFRSIQLITAGGGMEPGESISEAALREIKEETGLTDIRLGPVVWYGEDSHRSGNWGVTFKEHFIFVHSMSEDIQNDGWTEHERGQILEVRWWYIQDIGDCSDPKSAGSSRSASQRGSGRASSPSTNSLPDVL